MPVVGVRVGGELYAYRDACPGCGGSLADGALAAPARRGGRGRGAALPGVPARTSTSAGRGGGWTAPTCTWSRCRCWSGTASSRSRCPGRWAHDGRASRCPDDALAVLPGSGPRVRRPGPRSAARCAREPIARAAPARGRPGRPRADVHLPALLPAVHRRGRRAALPRRPRPVPVLPRRRGRRRASGTSWRSRSGWRSSSPTPRWAARWPSIPGRPAPPSSELPLGAWDRVVDAPTRRWHARPRRRGADRAHARPAARRAGGAFLVPIDRCYELVGALRTVWRGFDGGQEARALLDAFFADLAARSRPAPPRWRGRWPSCRSPSSTSSPERVRGRAEPAGPGAGARSPPASRCTRWRCAPRSASSRSAAGYDDTEEQALLDLFGDRTRFAETLRPFAWLHTSTVAQGFTGDDRDRPAAALHVRLRGLGHHVPARPAGRRDPAAVPLQRHGLHPRRRPASPSSRCHGTARRGTGCRSRSGAT